MGKKIKKLLYAKWTPVLVFAVLSLLYFATFIINDVGLLGSDHNIRGFFHRESLSNLFDLPNWSQDLGGSAVSDQRLGRRYFPLSVLHYFLPFYKGLGWTYILITFGAGFFMFLYLKSLKVRQEFSLLIGICYMFAPTFLSFTYSGQEAKMEVIALTPLLFLAIERGMESQKIRYFLLLSATVALMIYTNHLQMAYFALWGGGFYTLFKAMQIFRRDNNLKTLCKSSGFIVLALFLGIGIGAMNLFPPYWHTTTVSKRAGGVSPAYASSWSLHTEEMVSLIVPEFGNHLRNYWGQNAFKLNTEYMGIVPVLLALLALFGLKMRGEFWFFLFLFAFAAFYALGPHTLLHHLFYLYVPGVKSLRAPGMIAFLFLMATCVMAALSLERVASCGVAESKKIKVAACCLGGAGLILAFIVALFPQSVFNFWTSVFYPDITDPKRELMIANIPNVRKGILYFGIFLLTTLTLVYARLKGKIKDIHFLVLVLPLILIDTWRVDKDFLNYVNPSRVKKALAPETRLADFLKKDRTDFRVLARVNDPRFRMVGVNMVVYFSDFPNKRYNEITRLNNLNVINLLNAKYLISKNRLPYSGLKKVYDRDGFFVYQNPHAYPYFYLAEDYITEKDPNHILKKLQDPSFNSRKTVILEDYPKIDLDPMPSTDEQGGQIEKLFYNDFKGYLKLKVISDKPRFLVVSENDHPNWRAYIDGEEIKIFRANYIWKGVFLEPGEHIIEFKYFSKVASLFRSVSTFSFIVFVVLVAFIWPKRKIF